MISRFAAIDGDRAAEATPASTHPCSWSIDEVAIDDVVGTVTE
jgi:hypothetical protein